MSSASMQLWLVSKDSRLDRERSLPAFVKRCLSWAKAHKSLFRDASVTSWIVDVCAYVATHTDVLRKELWVDREFIWSLVAALK